MKNLLLSTVLMLLAGVFTACGNFDEDSLTDKMDVIVDGYVFDGIDLAPINGAKVTGRFGSKKTDKDGYYKIGTLSMGQFRFEIEAEGYMTKVLTPQFMESEDNFKGDELAYVFSTYMYKKDKTIKTILLDQVGITRKPFANIPYKILLGSEFKERIISGHTNENGEVEAIVPNSSFMISVDTIIGDKHYYLTKSVQQPSMISDFYTLNRQNVGVDLFYVTATNIIDDEGDNVRDFDPAQHVVMSFSEPLEVEESYFAIYKGSSTLDVNVDVSYSDDKKTVTISPYDGSFSEGQSYNVSFLAKSVSGDVYNSTLHFTTVGETQAALATPTTFALKTSINESTRYVDFEMQVDKNSEVVEVYGRYSGENEYVRIHRGYCYWENESFGILKIRNLNLRNLPGVDFPSEGVFSGTNYYELRVRTKMGTSYTDEVSSFSEVIRLKYGDVPATN